MTWADMKLQTDYFEWLFGVLLQPAPPPATLHAGQGDHETLWEIEGISRDGTDITVDADKITFRQYTKAVGIAWEPSNIGGAKKINAAIGIKQ